MNIAQVARDNAIDNAEQGAGAEWMKSAMSAIRFVAFVGEPFTSDQVRDLVPPCPEPRAWGAAFKRAENEGYIVPTGRWISSNRPTCHARPCREWVRK